MKKEKEEGNEDEDGREWKNSVVNRARGMRLRRRRDLTGGQVRATDCMMNAARGWGNVRDGLVDPRWRTTTEFSRR